MQLKCYQSWIIEFREGCFTCTYIHVFMKNDSTVLVCIQWAISEMWIILIKESCFNLQHACTFVTNMRQHCVDNRQCSIRHGYVKIYQNYRKQQLNQLNMLWIMYALFKLYTYPLSTDLGVFVAILQICLVLRFWTICTVTSEFESW